ncbi:dihydrofolate reductase [Bacteriovoracaceae bacterium]|nr:dihydrofolate reductase [Bacteriovoracaceae bacterium]
MILSLVAGIGKKRELGKDNKLLWHISEDLKNFKKITLGAPMIMGRNTFESLPGKLPGRDHIVLSKTMGETQGIYVVSNIEEALEKVKELGFDKASVVGGAKVYEQFLPLCQHIHISFVDFSGEADTFFPTYDFDKLELMEEKNFEGTEKTLPWRYCHYQQKI